MGGMIGANSVHNQGSLFSDSRICTLTETNLCLGTFAFFIKAQKPDSTQLQAIKEQDAALSTPVPPLIEDGKVSSSRASVPATPSNRNGPTILLVEGIVLA